MYLLRYRLEKFSFAGILAYLYVVSHAGAIVPKTPRSMGSRSNRIPMPARITVEFKYAEYLSIYMYWRI